VCFIGWHLSVSIKQRGKTPILIEIKSFFSPDELVIIGDLEAQIIHAVGYSGLIEVMTDSTEFKKFVQPRYQNQVIHSMLATNIRQLLYVVSEPGLIRYSVLVRLSDSTLQKYSVRLELWKMKTACILLGNINLIKLSEPFQDIANQRFQFWFLLYLTIKKKGRFKTWRSVRSYGQYLHSKSKFPVDTLHQIISSPSLPKGTPKNIITIKILLVVLYNIFILFKFYAAKSNSNLKRKQTRKKMNESNISFMKFLERFQRDS